MGLPAAIEYERQALESQRLERPRALDLHQFPALPHRHQCPGPFRSPTNPAGVHVSRTIPIARRDL